MKLGQNILNYRKKKGLSQEELGERINVTRQTISNWELGETSPNPEQLKLLSHELNVSVDELLDNDIRGILEEKVTSTEETTKKLLKIIKRFIIIVILVIFFTLLCLFIIKLLDVSTDTGNLVEESIYCKIYGEEHGYTIKYQELTGISVEEGGDTYFADVLELNKYNDANQKFNIINDYVKKNGGSCIRFKNRDLNDTVSMYIKEGTLTKTNATILIEEKEDYNLSYGFPFWIEKFDYKTNKYKKVSLVNDNCAFNLPAFWVTPDKPLELKQDWSCMYGELDKGLYRLVKNVFFDSDTPIDENKTFYISVEFSID